MNRSVVLTGAGLLLMALGCGGGESSKESTPSLDAAAAAGSLAATREQAQLVFGVLAAEAVDPDNPVTDAKIALGRTLYYDPRLSKNHDVSCNSCHDLAGFGVDGQTTSAGHRGQRGDRNSPTVYNAAFHIAQFWDGRAADVEEQAKGPVLNPIEMAMPGEEAVVAVLESIPGYEPMFRATFPGEAEPITYDNMARAIGAFERRLVTPGRFDAFLAGDDGALSEEEVAGLSTFMNTGCITCHAGSAVGGAMFQKLGAVKPYETKDVGREAVTGNASDRRVFKVPSLRNVARTAPYFHDGSVPSLDVAIRTMAEYQLGRKLDDAGIASITIFLTSLTGEIDVVYIAQPELPESGPDTPAPDPT